VPRKVFSKLPPPLQHRYQTEDTFLTGKDFFMGDIKDLKDLKEVKEKNKGEKKEEK